MTQNFVVNQGEFKPFQKHFTLKAISVLKNFFIFMYGKLAMTCLNIRCTCTVQKPSYI
jgi:hypothetical protein